MKNHPALLLPNDDCTVLSRYLSLAKLLDLLSSKELFFSKVSNLKDTFEGSLTYPEFVARREQIKNLFGKGTRPLEESMQKFTRLLRENTFLNCWTIGESESEAMWRLYCDAEEEGLCIRSTLKRLTDAVNDPRVYASQVRYLDYKDELFPSQNAVLGPFTCKRLAFKHEREFRLLITNVPPNFLDDAPGPTEIPDVSPDVPEKGRRVAVDTGVLIDSVVISPFSPEWYSKVVKAALESYLPDLTIVSSSLSGQPLY